MAMTYDTLVAPKGAAGSLANWVSYNKLDTVTILDEAQSLIYQALRVREMQSEMVLRLVTGQSQVYIPTDFLDPITPLVSAKYAIELRYKDLNEVQRQRVFEHLSGKLPTNSVMKLTDPVIKVNLPNHGMTVGSDFSVFNALPLSSGFDINKTGRVVTIIDANNFTFWHGYKSMASDGPGGGANMTYEANRLLAAYPTAWSVINDNDGFPQAIFDCAFEDNDQLRMFYYAKPALLSTDNQSNWLTNRYPKLLRLACTAAAAEFMKDDGEYTRNMTALTALVQAAAGENDLIYRGAEFGTDTP